MRVLDTAIGPLAIARGAYARLPSKQPTGTPVPCGVEGLLVRASTRQLPPIYHLSLVVGIKGKQSASHTQRTRAEHRLANRVPHCQPNVNPLVGNETAAMVALKTEKALNSTHLA